MQRVQSYKAEDGELFDDEVKCLKHDLMIKIRGLMQGSNAAIAGGIAGGRVTNAGDAANILCKQSDALAAIMKKYNADVSRAEKRKARV